MAELTQDILKEQLSYDPETGLFTRLICLAKRSKVGDIVGYKEPSNYIRIYIAGKNYQAHRLVWLYIYGCFPPADIDHINCNRSDNRLSNLREATRSESKCKQSSSANNKSGFKGVCWNKSNKKWQVACTVHGKIYHLGHFNTPEEASEIYQKFAKEHHGEFYKT